MTPARLAAVNALLALDSGSTTLASAIDRARVGLKDPRDRGLLVELATGAVRWRGALDARLTMASGRSLDVIDARVRAILRLAVYQIRHLDRVPAHAVVHDAVEQTRALGATRATGFVNAVLRAVLRDADAQALPPHPGPTPDEETAVAYLSIALSHPAWLVTRWLRREGFAAVERWCQFNNTPPDVTVRSAGRLSADELSARLIEAGVEARASAHVPEAWLLPPGTLGRLPSDLRGEIVAQDEGSQLVAWQLGAAPGLHVIDLCAAPGGKTRVLAGQMAGQGLLVACDWRASRVALLRTTVREARTPVRVVRLDARGALPFGAVFDRVLVDAPCSGIGVLRRDPDLKWTRQAEDLPRLADTARTILTQACDVLAPGGSLVYATCSTEPEENAAVVDAMLAARSDLTLQAVASPPPLRTAAGHLQTRPWADAMDGYFAAVLVRSGRPSSLFRPMSAARLPSSPSPRRFRAGPLGKRVWSAGRLLLLSTGLLATFGTFFLISTRVASRAREVTVPDIRGASLADATAALSRAGLSLRIDTRRADATVKIDHVLSQEPLAGTVIRRQRPVRVRVSDGQRDPVLPSVVGSAERTAEVVLAQEQIAIADRVEIRTTDVATGVVVAQTPAAKDRGAKVALLINRGERDASFVMPDVIGAPGGRIVDILRRHGFRVTVSAEVPYPGLPAGVVIRQTPQAGYQVGFGDAVTIEVSK